MSTTYKKPEPYLSLPALTDWDIMLFNESGAQYPNSVQLWTAGVHDLEACKVTNDGITGDEMKTLLGSALQPDHEKARDELESFYNTRPGISLSCTTSAFYAAAIVKIGNEFRRVDTVKGADLLLVGYAGIGSLLRNGFLQTDGYAELAIYSHFLLYLMHQHAPTKTQHLINLIQDEYPYFADTSSDSLLRYCGLPAPAGTPNYESIYKDHIPSWAIDFGDVISFDLPPYE